MSSPLSIKTERVQQHSSAESSLDDEFVDNAFIEIERLEQDVRTKRAAYYGTHQRHRSTSSLLYADYKGKSADDFNPLTALDDDMKTRLAMRTSAAISLPGVFDCDGRPLPKPSQQILLQRARNRKEEKKRQQGIETNGPTIGPEDEEEPLDDLQRRMNDFIEGTNKEDQEARNEKCEQHRRKRFRILIYCAIGLVVVIGVTVVGIVVGTRGGGSMDNTSALIEPLPPSFSPPAVTSCTLGEETNQSERYTQIRSIIVSEYPAMAGPTASGSTSIARIALCRFVYQDGLIADVATPNAVYSQVTQRFVLGLIYTRFGMWSDSLGASNWLSAIPECEWDFLMCDEVTNMKVIGLDLSTQRLDGTMPTELAMLTNLVHLNLASNLLMGEIPSELWTMTQLETLALFPNRFTGTFPAELVALTGLKRLELGRGSFMGFLPDMGALSHLETIYLLNENAVMSPFPNMSGWTNLSEFTPSLSHQLSYYLLTSHGGYRNTTSWWD